MPADAIPDSLDADLSGLDINDAIHISAVHAAGGRAARRSATATSRSATIAVPAGFKEDEEAEPAEPAAEAPAKPDGRRRSRPSGGTPALEPLGEAPPCASSSVSAIPARATPATGTMSASWQSTRSPALHGASPWRRRFQGEATEAVLGGERVLMLKPQTYMNESGRAVAAGAALLQDPACGRGRLPRRARPPARKAAGEARGRQRRAQRPALDHGANAATTTGACGSASGIRATRRWCTPTC